MVKTNEELQSVYPEIEFNKNKDKSNVVIKRVLNAKVSQGVKSQITTAIDITGFSKVYVAVKTEERHSFRVGLAFFIHQNNQTTFGQQLSEYEEVINAEYENMKVSKHIDVKGTLMNLSIENPISEDRYYDLFVMGVR